MLMSGLCLCRKGEENRMVAYMEQKYGESFAVMESYAGQFGKDYTMLRMRSISRNQEGVLVRASGRADIAYQDNYLAYLLKEEIEYRLAQSAKASLGECKVFYKIPDLVFPAEFPADMEADAFLRHPQSKVRVYIYVRDCSADIQKRVDDFFSKMQKQKYIIGGVISCPMDEVMYEMITEENFRGDVYLGYQSVTEAVFSMDELGKLVYLEWKGEIPNE